jgi:hypothetical protein
VSFLNTSRKSLSGSLAFCRATPPCACACPLALAPRVCACPLAAAPRAWARPLAAASQACLCSLAAPLLAANQVHICLVRATLGDALGLHSPSAGDILASRPASPCIQGANASGLAAVTLSASPPDFMQAVLSARAGTAPATGSALPRSYVLMPEGSTLPASAFSTMPASPKWSTSSGNTGESPGTNGTPTCF